MTHNCKCGGRLRRTDIIGKYHPQHKRVLYEDLDPCYANWCCDKCGASVRQKKRQPKEKHGNSEQSRGIAF